jgi:hypothetical protein
MKKYELTSETKFVIGKTLYRIKALVSFGTVSAGDTGGFVEKEENLSQSGDAWVYGNAEVSGNAEVCWFSNVGSENGTLTAMKDKSGGIIVNRGCFNGTLQEFQDAVKERHGDNEHGRMYAALITAIKIKMGV